MFLSRFSKFLFFTLVICISDARAAEEILNYDVDISVQSSGDLLITEWISVRAEGNNINRGIYRDFPTDYKDRFGHKVHVDFSVLDVERNDREEDYHTQKHQNGVRVYIGSKDRMVPHGEHTYKLTFRTTRQLGFFEKHDELYFNAIGHGWNFPILEASVRVNLPSSIDPSSVELDAWAGPQGSQGERAVNREKLLGGKYQFTLAERLNKREGLTILLTWPKGKIAEPTFSQKLRYFLDDNISTLVGVLGLLLCGVYLYRTWARVGKDPEKGIIIPRYEPPAGMTPYGMRYTIKMGFDPKCLACAVTELAVKGLLTISEKDKLIGKDYSLLKVEPMPSQRGLSSTLQSVMAILLGGKTVFKLDDKNYKEVRQALNVLEAEAKSKHLGLSFIQNHQYIAIGILICSATILLMGVAAGGVEPLFAASNIAVIVLLLLMFGVFSIIIKAPTRSGRALMDHIEGYKLYLQVGEKDILQGASWPKVTEEIFEEHLPFAMALDVEDRWAKAFEHQLIASGQRPESYHPVWYSGRGNVLSGNNFASSIGSGFSSAIASSSTPPGSSSGSGGGGSSGGGGGGGGGGGW